MTATRKILLAILAAVMLSVLVPGAPASAHYCYRDTCTGLDPVDADCGGDARTVQEYQYRGVYIEMRFSSYCDAVWTRVWTAEHRNTDFGQINAYSCRDAACRYLQYGVQAKGGTWWTKMIGLPNDGARIFKSCYNTWFSGAPYFCQGYVEWG